MEKSHRSLNLLTLTEYMLSVAIKHFILVFPMVFTEMLLDGSKSFSTIFLLFTKENLIRSLHSFANLLDTFRIN